MRHPSGVPRGRGPARSLGFHSGLGSESTAQTSAQPNPLPAPRRPPRGDALPPRAATPPALRRVRFDRPYKHAMHVGSEQMVLTVHQQRFKEQGFASTGAPAVGGRPACRCPPRPP